MCVFVWWWFVHGLVAVRRIERRVEWLVNMRIDLYPVWLGVTGSVLGVT